MHALADLVRAGMIRYFGAFQPQGVAHRRDLQHLRPDRHRPPGRDPAALQRAQPHGRGRAVPGGRLLRPGRRSLQPAGARRAVGQVRAGRHAACRQPRGAQRSAHDADGVAAGIAGDRAEAEDPRRGAWHDRQPVRHGLGAGEPPGHLGDLPGRAPKPNSPTMSARLATSCPPTARPWSTAWWFRDIRRRPATATRWSRRKAGCCAADGGKPASRQRLSVRKSRNVKSGALVLWREDTRRPDHNSTARARWNDMILASCQRGFASARQAT